MQMFADLVRMHVVLCQGMPLPENMSGQYENNQATLKSYKLWPPDYLSITEYSAILLSFWLNT